MTGDLGTPTMTKIIKYIIYLQIMIICAYAKDITLIKPQSTIIAQVGEELRITCLGTKCENPEFIWSSLADSPLRGITNNFGQISILTMKISRENLDQYDPYRCTVRCDKPPAEKGFKVIVYSFPKPILTISSRIAGEQSLITCTIPDAYPFYMVKAWIWIGERIVTEYDPEKDEGIDVMKNISLSHDLILTEENEAQKIKCEAELQFQEDGIDPINQNTSMHLELLYPPGKPNITVFPATNVNAGENILLTCTYESRSLVSLQWMKLDKDNKMVKLSIFREILTIRNAKPEDSGMYICRVWNDVGERSSQVQITIQALPEKPKLTISPTTTVQVGTSVTIECLTNDKKNVNVTLWKVLRDGDTLLLEAKGKLVIKEANPMDTAVYKCTAENHYGESEASESLTVEYPPMETTLTSSDEEVNEGGEITLTCASKGVPEPSFILYHLLPSGHRVLLSEGPVVTLANVTSGIYQCEAINTLGSKKETLELTVRFPPRNTFLTITPSLVTREGESLHIRCTSEAYPAPRLVLKKKTKTGLTELKAENGQYSIINVTEEHAGRYICESSNMLGQQEIKATVIVQVPPKNTNITMTPSAEVGEGESIDIRCISEASPAPRLSLKMMNEDGVRELVSENGQYQIAHVHMKHSGTYICESTNIAGQQQVETTLTILVPPKNTFILISPSSLVKEGDDVHIQCVSQAYPSPVLVLMMKTEHGLINKLESENGGYNITNAGEKNIGTYICESTNLFGQQTAEDTLTVQIPPRNTTVVTPSQNITAGVTVTVTYDTHIIPPQERQQSSRFDYVPPAIIGSVVLVTAGFIAIIAYHLKQAKVQGSYSLVKALRSKV
ncbi:vascular cell adhesion protein 1 [Mantella aurantiaca]